MGARAGPDRDPAGLRVCPYGDPGTGLGPDGGANGAALFLRIAGPGAGGSGADCRPGKNLLQSFVHFRKKPTRAADRSVRQAGRERRRLVLLLAVGLLPLLLEILLQRWTAALYTKPLVWAAFLALGGFVLFLSTARSGGGEDARQMRLPDALLIGAAQAVSVLPGLSRTGLTVAAGLYRGAKAEFSLEYSFLLAVPFWLGWDYPHHPGLRGRGHRCAAAGVFGRSNRLRPRGALCAGASAAIDAERAGATLPL